MTVTGISKSMQTHTYFAFWRQKLLNVYPTFRGTSYLYCFWIFMYLLHIHFIEICVTGMTDYLSDSLLTLVNRFIFTSKQTFIK